MTPRTQPTSYISMTELRPDRVRISSSEIQQNTDIGIQGPIRHHY